MTPVTEIKSVNKVANKSISGLKVHGRSRLLSQERAVVVLRLRSDHCTIQIELRGVASVAALTQRAQTMKPGLKRPVNAAAF